MSRSSRLRQPAGTRTLVLGGFALILQAGCQHSRPPVPPAPPPQGEVVSDGFQTKEKRNLTGAVSSLGEADLHRVRVGSMADLLRHRVPGLLVTTLPGGRLSLRIRGAPAQGGEPLIVIDGAPSASLDLAALAPQEIARIDVLKDAGAAAIYGSRGGNGVISITTRRAR